METKIVLLISFFAVLFFDRLVAEHISRERGAKGMSALTAEGRKTAFELLKSRDYLYLLPNLLSVAFLLNVVISVFEESYIPGLVLLGFTLMLASMPVHFAGRRDLGKNWTPFTRTEKNQRLVKTGVYARVRHPIFLSYLMLYLGMALIAANLLSLFLFVSTLIVLLARARREERELVAKFGKEYVEYAKRTPAFIPRIR